MMSSCVAFLRAINVGGTKPISMESLRDLCANVGLVRAKTLLNSGNVVFNTKGRSTARLEHLLQSEAAKRLSLETDFFVRSGQEMSQIISGNPFQHEADNDPAHLVVMFLKNKPTPKMVQELNEAIPGRETVRVRGREAFVVYPDGIGNSRLSVKLIEKCLSTPGTGRNWNTILRIAEMLRELSDT